MEHQNVSVRLLLLMMMMMTMLKAIFCQTNNTADDNDNCQITSADTKYIAFRFVNT